MKGMNSVSVSAIVHDQEVLLRSEGIWWSVLHISGANRSGWEEGYIRGTSTEEAKVLCHGLELSGVHLLGELWTASRR